MIQTIQYYEIPIMKKMQFISLAFVITSCGKDPKQSVADMWTIEIDTVNVNAGEEILYLEKNLHYSTLSLNERYLYNFNEYDNTFEKIDLEELELVGKIPFEREGPNGIGNDIYQVTMLNEDQLYLSSFIASGQFLLDGKKIKNYDLYNHGLSGDVLSKNEELRDNIMIPGQSDIVFAIASNLEDNSISLRKMNFSNQQISKYDIDPDKTISKFYFKVPSISNGPIIGPNIFLSAENGKLIISSNIENKIYIYEHEEDKFFSKNSNNRLTNNEKQGFYAGEYESIAKLMDDYKKILEEISFTPPVWDRTNELYYRFSYFIEFSEEKEEGQFLPKTLQVNIFLTIYDKDFKIVSEVPLPQLSKTPSRYFVRDGMIWIYENFEDELAFIRLTIKEGV